MIVIIDYGMGNSISVKKAFDFLKIPSLISSKKDEIKKAEKLLIPGVGAFGDAVTALHQLDIFETIKEEVLLNKKPILGICLGMQLLAEASEESPHAEGFGFIKGSCKKFQINLKVPHVGWNNITHNNSTLFKNIPNNSDFYFVHSYHFDTTTKEKTSTLVYGYEFCSSLEKENIYGVQFHPEKSQKFGLELLRNFGGLPC